MTLPAPTRRADDASAPSQPTPAHPVAAHDLGFDLPPPATVSRKGLVGIVAGVVSVLALAFAAGYLPRRQERAALEEVAVRTPAASRGSRW